MENIKSLKLLFLDYKLYNIAPPISFTHFLSQYPEKFIRFVFSNKTSEDEIFQLILSALTFNKTPIFCNFVMTIAISKLSVSTIERIVDLNIIDRRKSVAPQVAISKYRYDVYLKLKELGFTNINEMSELSILVDYYFNRRLYPVISTWEEVLALIKRHTSSVNYMVIVSYVIAYTFKYGGDVKLRLEELGIKTSLLKKLETFPYIVCLEILKLDYDPSYDYFIYSDNKNLNLSLTLKIFAVKSDHPVSNCKCIFNFSRYTIDELSKTYGDSLITIDYFDKEEFLRKLNLIIS